MMNEVTFHLEAFEGPLDLLLFLISKNKIEITDIPIAEILRQYLEYIKQMQEFDLEIASEFITMAAHLMQIKSKLLLPIHGDEPQEDPRAQLVEMLREYQYFKQAGGYLGGRSELGLDIYVRPQEPLSRDYSSIKYDHSANDLAKAIESIMQRAERRLPPPVAAFRSIVGREAVPVSGRITHILNLFAKQDRISLEKLFMSSQNRSELVAYFLAVLELSKDGRVILENNGNDDFYLMLSPENTEVADGNK